MNIVTDIFLPLALAFIMFALGLGLTGADFLRVIKQPKDFFVGALSQIILLPIINIPLSNNTMIYIIEIILILLRILILFNLCLK